MAIGKADNAARQHWGSIAYDAIPKSVFAVAAWHLANLASEELDNPHEVARRFVEEIEALGLNGIIEPRHVKLVKGNVPTGY